MNSYTPRMLRRTLIGALCMLMVSMPALADVSGDLTNFFNSLNMGTSVTDPGAYQGQEAGYYTGGSLFVRAPSRQYQFASFQPPSLRFGCNGIDAFTGSFSFINSQQLVSAVKNIGSNAVSYAFELALATISPQIKSVLNTLQGWANKVNALSKNSCTAAEQLVNGSVRFAAGKKWECALHGVDQGIFPDVAAGTEGCGPQGQTSTDLSQEQKNDPNNTWGQYNLVWKSLQQIPALKVDPQLAEFIMSLTGTYIVVENNGNYQHYTRAPLYAADLSNLYGALIGNAANPQSTTLSYYACNPAPVNGDITTVSCLTLTPATATIPTSAQLGTLVRGYLENMVTDIDNNQALGAPEQNFLGNVSTPIYKYLQVTEAYNPALSQQLINETSTMLGAELLEHYLKGLVSNINNAVSQGNAPAKGENAVLKNIESAEAALGKFASKLQIRTSAQFTLLQHIQVIQKELVSSMSPSMSSTMRWSNAMNESSGA